MGERTRHYSVRPRRVPPEFCTDELLESCSLLAALLLYRLISQADDQGRLPGHPRYVKATCFPMRPEISERKVETAITELVRAGFVIRYDIAGRWYLQVARWFDLQGKWGQRRTYPSRYPSPPDWDEDWVNAGADEEQVRAPGAQGAGDVRPPISPPSSNSSTPPLAGLGSTATGSKGFERVGDLLERARHGRLTDEEAIELGSAVASVELSGQHR